MSNLEFYSCNYPLSFLHQSVIFCWIKQITMQTCSNISHLLIKTTVPFPINCSGYFFVCIFRAEFEKVIFLHCYYFLAWPLLLPRMYSYGAFTLGISIKTIFFYALSHLYIAKFKSMFQSLWTWPLATIYEAFLPATLSSLCFCNSLHFP